MACDARRKSAGGFSLLELMIVVVILGIMAGTASPMIGRIYDNLEFRRQISKFSATLRYAKLLAVTKGETVHLTLAEGEDCIFRLRGPVDESRECTLGDEEVLTMDPGEIYFFPEGTATPTLLTFKRAERVKLIRIDLLTARPVIE